MTKPQCSYVLVAVNAIQHRFADSNIFIDRTKFNDLTSPDPGFDLSASASVRS